MWLLRVLQARTVEQKTMFPLRVLMIEKEKVRNTAVSSLISILF